MLTLVGTFAGSFGNKIEVAHDEYDTVLSYIDGKIAIENNKVYLSTVLTGGAVESDILRVVLVVRR